MQVFSSVMNLFSRQISRTPLSTLTIAFSASPIAMLVVKANGQIVQINDKFVSLTGYSSKDIVGENMSLLKSSKHDNRFYNELWKKFKEHETHSFEIYNRCQDGRILLFKEQIQRVEISSDAYFIITLEDITQQKKQESRQIHLATHDPLTGLANRALLDDRYKHALLTAKRNHSKLGVMICDLNEFKQVNDLYGHTFGDEVLKNFASRLSSLVRESDTVSRYGGDEFIVIFEQINNGVKVEEVYNMLLEKLRFDVEHDGSTCEVSASLGYACFPDEGTTFEQLVNVADMKMYNSKKSYYGC